MTGVNRKSSLGIRWKSRGSAWGADSLEGGTAERSPEREMGRGWEGCTFPNLCSIENALDSQVWGKSPSTLGLKSKRVDPL